MTEADYKSFRTALEDTFLAVYLIDAGSLTAEQRLVHQQALSTAYLAVVRAENKVLSDLTAQAIEKLKKLATVTTALQAQLAGLKKGAKVLEIVSGAIDTLKSITKLLK